MGAPHTASQQGASHTQGTPHTGAHTQIPPQTMEEARSMIIAQRDSDQKKWQESHGLNVCFLFSSEEVCKRGFTVIVDMRGSKWDSIKPLLKILQESFPCCIHVALIIKPDNFWQKQRTNFGSSKFEFEVTPMCSQTNHTEIGVVY